MAVIVPSRCSPAWSGLDRSGKVWCPMGISRHDKVR